MSLETVPDYVSIEWVLQIIEEARKGFEDEFHEIQRERKKRRKREFSDQRYHSAMCAAGALTLLHQRIRKEAAKAEDDE